MYCIICTITSMYTIMLVQKYHHKNDILRREIECKTHTEIHTHNYSDKLFL